MDLNFDNLGSSLVTVILPLIATIIGGILAYYYSSQNVEAAFTSAKKITDDKLEDESLSFEEKKRNHLERRIDEVLETANKFQTVATRNRLSNGFLVFGQYIVGVALTSSFLQESLSPVWIGILGLIVLLATIIHQRFRPDAQAKVAATRALFLYSTLRKIEDNLYINETPPIEGYIRRLTRSLNKAEDPSEWLLETDPEQQDE